MSLRPIINQFLTKKRIAIAGVSRDRKKFGNILFWALLNKGYEVYPINPNTDAIEGKYCYRHLEDLPKDIKNLLVTTSKKDTKKVVQEAIDNGFKNIWIQNGCETSEAIALAKENNVNLVFGACFLMYAEPKGFHKFHQMIARLIGKYEA